MTLKGIDLVNSIEESATNAGKIFIPDSFDEAVANSVVNFASRQHAEWEQILTSLVDDYVKNSGFTLTVKEFGNKVPDMFMKAKSVFDKRKEFDFLVKQTQKRMGQ